VKKLFTLTRPKQHWGFSLLNGQKFTKKKNQGHGERKERGGSVHPVGKDYKVFEEARLR